MWLVVLAAGVCGVGPALAATPTDPDRSAQVQAVLDRVLGPGNAVVEIAATVRAGSGSTTTVAWGAALPASVAGSSVRTPDGVAVSLARVDAVDRTSTTLDVPVGALLQQTVAVAVDRRAAAGIPVGRLRRLVAAAAGLTPSRGDRLVLVETRFARVAPARPAATSWTAALIPFAVPAIEVAGALAALGVLILALGRRPRAGRSDR